MEQNNWQSKAVWRTARAAITAPRGAVTNCLTVWPEPRKGASLVHDARHGATCYAAETEILRRELACARADIQCLRSWVEATQNWVVSSAHRRTAAELDVQGVWELMVGDVLGLSQNASTPQWQTLPAPVSRCQASVPVDAQVDGDFVSLLPSYQMSPGPTTPFSTTAGMSDG